MNIKTYLFLTLLSLPIVSLNAMNHTGSQYAVVADDYIRKLITITKDTNCKPILLEHEITQLMNQSQTWKLLLTNPITAGMIVKQISDHNKSAMYPVAIMLNTPGTLQWLQGYLKNNPKKHGEVAELMEQMLLKIADSKKIPISLTRTLIHVEKLLTEPTAKKIIKQYKNTIRKKALKKQNHELVTLLDS